MRAVGTGAAAFGKVAAEGAAITRARAARVGCDELADTRCHVGAVSAIYQVIRSKTPVASCCPLPFRVCRRICVDAVLAR